METCPAKFTIREGEKVWRCGCGGRLATIVDGLLMLPRNYGRRANGIYAKTERPFLRTEEGKTARKLLHHIKESPNDDISADIREMIKAHPDYEFMFAASRRSNGAPTGQFLRKEDLSASVHCPGCHKVCIIPSVYGRPE